MKCNRIQTYKYQGDWEERSERSVAHVLPGLVASGGGRARVRDEAQLPEPNRAVRRAGREQVAKGHRRKRADPAVTRRNTHTHPAPLVDALLVPLLAAVALHTTVTTAFTATVTIIVIIVVLRAQHLWHLWRVGYCGLGAAEEPYAGGEEGAVTRLASGRLSRLCTRQRVCAQLACTQHYRALPAHAHQSCRLALGREHQRLLRRAGWGGHWCRSGLGIIVCIVQRKDGSSPLNGPQRDRTKSWNEEIIYYYYTVRV